MCSIELTFTQTRSEQWSPECIGNKATRLQMTTLQHEVRCCKGRTSFIIIKAVRSCSHTSILILHRFISSKHAVFYHLKIYPRLEALFVASPLTLFRAGYFYYVNGREWGRKKPPLGSTQKWCQMIYLGYMSIPLKFWVIIFLF